MPGDDDYDIHAYQYATTSEPAGTLRPGAIIYPKNDESGYDDIRKAMQYCRQNSLAASVRTGGHSYIGCSSTRGDNVQINMRNWTHFSYDEEKNLMAFGPGWPLMELNEKMAEYGTFVPHGECRGVFLGGHCGTGGYSLLTRSFGLLVDHIASLEIMLPGSVEPELRVLYKPEAGKTTAENDDIWFSAIGGSPGNIGVVTKIVLYPLHNKDFERSLAMQWVYTLNYDLLEALLVLAAKYADNDDWPANFNLSVLAIGASQQPWYPQTEDEAMYEELKKLHPEFKNGMPKINPPSLVLTASWIDLENKGPTDEVKAWFDELKDCCKDFYLSMPPAIKIPVSSMSNDMWEKGAYKYTVPSDIMEISTWRNEREWALPFEKRVFVTPSKTLSRGDAFAKWCRERCEYIESPSDNGCKLGAQFAPMGGKHSRLLLNRATNPTALGWRDANMNASFDAFYETHHAKLIPFTDPEPWPEAKQTAIEFGLGNDRGAYGVEGEPGVLSDRKRILIYAPHGSHVLDDVWADYFDTREVYDRVLRVKKTVDPDHILTANMFAVGATHKEQKDEKPAQKRSKAVEPEHPVDHDLEMAVALGHTYPDAIAHKARKNSKKSDL